MARSRAQPRHKEAVFLVQGHRPGSHVVQFYQQDTSLLDALTVFVGAALRAGGAAIVIATQAHREALKERLIAGGLDLPAIQQGGRYLSIDAYEALSKVMVEGEPDKARFTHAMGDLIDRARTKTGPDHYEVAVFGEMVSLLWAQEQREAAIQLEKFWNDLLEKHRFYLRCGYLLSSYHSDRDRLLEVRAEHSGVIADGDGCAVSAGEGALPRSGAGIDVFRYRTALQQTEERFRLLLEAVEDYAIFLLDSQGYIISWNRGAERIKGYTAAEILGQPFSVFYPRRDIESGKPERLLRAAATEGRSEDEGWRIRKDGSAFWANVIITALRDKAGNLKGFAKITRDLTKKKEYEDSLSRLASRLLSLQDQERRRLARELHDSTAQNLAALAINLGLLHDLGLGAAGPDTAKVLSECRKLADQAANDVRNISHLLHPPELDALGLARAIRWFVQRYIERTGILVEMDLPKGDLRLPQGVEITLFRIVQEALTNVHRHSGSSTASVRLETHKAEAVVSIQDRGRGLPRHAAPHAGNGGAEDTGVGLAIMQERLRELGGQLQIDSTHRGTTLIASVPLNGAVLPEWRSSFKPLNCRLPPPLGQEVEPVR